MLIYFILLSCLILFSLLNPYIKYDRPMTIGLLLSVECILVIFSGIRYDVGVDYMNYSEMFDEALVLNEGQQEAGFVLGLHLCRLWGIPFEGIVFVFSAFTVMLAFRFIKQYSPFVFFSVLIFYSFGQYYFNSFNAMRQTVVIYAFLSSSEWIRSRKWKPFFLMIGISTVCVHASALLLLPLYFILHRKFSFYMKVGILVFALLSTELIVRLIGVSNYAIYLKFDQFASNVNASTYFLLVLAVYFFLWDIFQGKRLPDYRVLFNVNFISLLMLTLVILFGGTPLIMVTNRFSYYFTPVYIVLLPIAIGRFHRIGNQFILILFLSLIYSCILYMVLIVNGESNNLVPYQTIFNK